MWNIWYTGQFLITCSRFSLFFILFHWFSLFFFIKITIEKQEKPSLVMMRECPCSTKTRDGLGNPLSALEISLGHGFCTLRPRVSGCKTHDHGKSLGSREILGVGDGFPNPSLLLVEHGYILWRHLKLRCCQISAEMEKASWIAQMQIWPPKN